MSAARKPRAASAQSGAATDRALLERCGLVDANGRVSGAERTHPDAELLELVAECTTLMQSGYAKMGRLSRYKEDGRAYRRLWAEILSAYKAEEKLELEILAIKAHTRLGLLAKMGLYCDKHGDNAGTMVGHPMAVMREAMAMLGDDPTYAPLEPA